MRSHFILSSTLLLAALAASVLTGCHDHPLDADPCRTAVLIGGVDDHFAPGNIEEADPSPELMNYMVGNYYSPYLYHQFDQTQTNRPVGHTFQLPGVDLEHPTEVKKAIFTMRVRAIGSQLETDWFHLMVNDGNGSVLGIYDASLAVLNSGSWTAGNVQTVTLDLGALGLLDELSDGALHVYLQDDTAVDFVRLEVEYCGECKDDDPSRGDV